MVGTSERERVVQQLSIPLYALPAINPRLLICLLRRGIARVGDVVPHSSEEIEHWLIDAGHRGQNVRELHDAVAALFHQLQRLTLPFGAPLPSPLAEAYQEMTKKHPLVKRLLGNYLHVWAPCPTCGTVRLMDMAFYETAMIKGVARGRCACLHGYCPTGNAATRVNRRAGADAEYVGSRE